MVAHKNKKAHGNLVMFLDMDVFMIGKLWKVHKGKQVLVQVNKFSVRELQLLSLSSIRKALQNDPDLGRQNSKDLPQPNQAMYFSAGSLF